MRKNDKKLAKAILLGLALSTVFTTSAGAADVRFDALIAGKLPGDTITIGEDTVVKHIPVTTGVNTEWDQNNIGKYMINVSNGANVTFDKMISYNPTITGDGNITINTLTKNDGQYVEGAALHGLVIAPESPSVISANTSIHANNLTIISNNDGWDGQGIMVLNETGTGNAKPEVNIDLTGKLDIQSGYDGIHFENNAKGDIDIQAKETMITAPKDAVRVLGQSGNSITITADKNTFEAGRHGIRAGGDRNRVEVTALDGNNEITAVQNGIFAERGWITVTAEKGQNTITSTNGSGIRADDGGYVSVYGAKNSITVNEQGDHNAIESGLNAFKGQNTITSTNGSGIRADDGGYVSVYGEKNSITVNEQGDHNAIESGLNAFVVVDGTSTEITGNIAADKNGVAIAHFNDDESFLKGKVTTDYGENGTFSKSRTVLIFKDGATWNVTGSSNVTYLEVNKAVIDMSADGGVGSKLTIDQGLNLSGATLKMDLAYLGDTVDKYIGEENTTSDFITANGEAALDDASTLVIAAKDNDYSQNLDKMNDGNKLYFARIVGEQEASKFNGQKISYVNNKNLYNYTYAIESEITPVTVKVIDDSQGGGKVMAAQAAVSTMATIADPIYVEKDVDYTDYYITKVQKEVTPGDDDTDDDKDHDDPVKPNENITSEKGKMLAGYALATEMDRLNKRLGEARYMEDEKGLWVRYRHNRVGYDNTFTNKGNMFQIGYDKERIEQDGKHYRGGAIDYTRATTELNNVAGKGEHDRYGVSLYDTWLGNKGHYHDLVIRAGRINSDFDVYNADGKINSDYHRNFASISGEYGRKITGKNGWYVEPQAQLQVARVGEANYTTNRGVRVEQEGATSVLGRLGFRLGREYLDADGNKANNYYIKADYMHEFAGDQAYRVTGADGTFREEVGARNFYDIGVGADIKIKKGQYFWADVERTFGGDYDTTWQVNGGFRWEF